ncbi:MULTISPECIES: ABC transporter ATP-binding protein [unclassified Yoonia]|uniref:ABC transporter ATP-binding protein n=1 Tax=unclassified Yoonia TaxID=2629118 RepID=UPI002AFDF816|nr:MULTISPECIES: ABC transporter ATP-binding protein [unclassified Yoonia]
MTAASLRVTHIGWGPAGQAAILSGIGFDLAPGRMLGIVGANGAGKSTLLRMLYRFHRPMTGTVILDGRDLWQMSAREAACRIAVVLQEQPTDFALNVREIVALGRTPHRRGFASGGARDMQIVDHALDRLDLQGLAHRALGTLSGGEKQRVMVARALAQEPGLLILDEPTNHLDIRHQLEVLALVRNLGITIVTSLHDLNLANGLCDDVLVLADGHALAFGPPAKVLTEAVVARSFRVTARRETLHPSGQAHFTYHLPTAKRT